MNKTRAAQSNNISI